MDSLIMAALQEALEWVVVKTGAVVVRAVSLGRWQAEPAHAAKHLTHAPAGALWFRSEGRIRVTVTGQTVVGTLTWFLAASGAIGILMLRAA